MEYHTIVVGGGAAGLMAALHLARNNKRVLVLEAGPRAGGRIHTLFKSDFKDAVELGAEFVHGDLPLTTGLLKSYDIPYKPIKGNTWRCEHNILAEDNDVIQNHELLEKQLLELTHDMPVQQFVKEFPSLPEYEQLKETVTRFVEAYDTADTSRASAAAFREEWLGYTEETQYRVQGGYIKLIDALENDLMSCGGKILFDQHVTDINWRLGQVEVVTREMKMFTAEKAVITVSAGVMQQLPDAEGRLNIEPAPLDHLEAYRNIGFGKVMKINLEFSEPFWERPSDLRPTLRDVNFIFSDATIPTWWYNNNNEMHLLTGWIGGPDAAKLCSQTDDELLQTAFESLSYIFKEDILSVKSFLIASKVANWCKDPLFHGSYRYNTVHDSRHIDTLRTPVHNTLYFAGEAVYKGPNTGTVEAALVSGLNCAHLILEKA